jgi:hypothetical protein
MALDDSKMSEVQKHFQALSAAASSLNTASGVLTQVVSILDESLKKLNVGIAAWVTFRSRDDDNRDPHDYDEDQIGYCKIRGMWGIALRRIWGNTHSFEGDSEGPWLFNDAPRDMRIAGVDAIPKLIQELCEQASETEKKVVEKTLKIRELADAIQQVVIVEKAGIKPPPSLIPPKSSPTLADMADPKKPTLTSPFQPVPQIQPTLRDMVQGKKGGK